MIAPNDLIALLNSLLEAERAGAKVLSAYLADYGVGTAEWNALKAIQQDESRNCVVLMHLLKYVGGDASAATGSYLTKALEVEGREKRLQFLNAGQAWVARRIGEALPTIYDAHVKRGLNEMYDSHRQNIAKCDLILHELTTDGAPTV